MTLRRPALLVAAALALTALPPAAARAATPAFKDLVVTGPQAGPTARAAQAGARRYTAPDGTRVPVTLSATYAADPARAQRAVDVLAGLRHGAELARLNVYVGTPAEVRGRCGTDDEGVLACYLPAEDLMVVPGEPAPGSPVPPDYVVAHEYGHHVANHRSNAPFSAMLFGPKRWASQQDVCTKTLAGRLAPGDEADDYASNPGEAWAETYAQLEYPAVRWTFTPLLQPTEASFTAARLDVDAPWTRRRARTFRGRLDGRRTSRSHTFRLTLDGSLTVQLTGPRAANFDLAVRSGDEAQGSTRARGSRDRLTYTAACVEEPETVTVTVRRRSGAGAYAVRVALAG